MSIFATALSLDAAGHNERCTRWALLAGDDPDPGRMLLCDDKRYRYDDARPCTCSAGPLRYDASHLLPEPDGQRAGFVSLCEIPGFISRPGRELCGDDDECPKPATQCCDRVWPYLRLWVWDGRVRESGSDFTGCPVLLDRDQVEQVHAYLGRWLERAAISHAPKGDLEGYREGGSDG